MRKTIEIKFNIGDSVIIKTEPDVKRQISGILLRHKSVTYLIRKGDDELGFQDIEIAPCLKPFKVTGFGK